jgi:pimeloyl-ACP methyl ester carboxylesterase
VDRPARRRDRAHVGADLAVLWRLGNLHYETAGKAFGDPVGAEAFWQASSVHHPADVSVVAVWEHRRSRELLLEARSAGPGTHPGARKLIATAFVTRGLPADAPLVLFLHGYAVPVPFWDALQARHLRDHGAHSIRLDLPFHLRRRVPGHRSGDGFFGTDPARLRATVRQAVEDAAAMVAWARAEVTPAVAVMGVSLGGLVATLLAAHVRLDSVVAVAPLCDPPATFLENMPRKLARRVGLSPTTGGAWGEDRGEARAMLDATLAPLVPRNLVPRTPPENITFIRPELDVIVGPQPIADLAHAWGAELWDYPYGHITVMNAPGVGARIRDRLLDVHPERAVDLPDAASF